MNTQRFHPWCVLVVCLVWSSPLLAQNAIVEGTVRGEDGSSVVDAEVRLDPVSEGRAAKRMKSKKDGSYKIPLVEHGTYRLSVVKEGLVPQEFSVAIRLPSNQLEDETKAAPVEGRYTELKIEPSRKVRVDVIMGAQARRSAATPSSSTGSSSGLNEANALTRARDFAGSDALLQEIVAKGGETGPALYLMGLNAAGLGRREDALGLFRRALELDPGLAGVRGQIAAMLFAQGDKQGAAKFFREELDLDPTIVPVALNLAVSLRDAGQREEAVEAWRRVIDLAPDEAKAYGELAALLTDLGRKDEAAEVLRRGESVGTPDPGHWFNIAAGLSNEDKYDEAEAAYRKALDLDPAFAPAHREIGLLLARKGEVVSAVESLDRYLDLAPDAPDASEVRAMANELRKSAKP